MDRSPSHYGRVMGQNESTQQALLVQEDLVFHRAMVALEVLYTTTVRVRVVLLALLGWLLVDSRNPLFLSVGGVVALGMVLTTLGIVIDRRARAVDAGRTGSS